MKKGTDTGDAGLAEVAAYLPRVCSDSFDWASVRGQAETHAKRGLHSFEALKSSRKCDRDAAVRPMFSVPSSSEDEDVGLPLRNPCETPAVSETTALSARLTRCKTHTRILAWQSLRSSKQGCMAGCPGIRDTLRIG